MGRKRKAPVAHWSDKDIIELLAQLNRTVLGNNQSFTNMKDDEINSTIDSRLASLEKKLKNQYTKSQIRRKLLDILKQGDDNATYNFRTVFTLGASAMRSLDIDTMCMVQARLDDICLTEERQPRATSQRLDSPQKAQCRTPGYQNTPPRKSKISKSTPRRREKNWRGPTSITPSQASISINVAPFGSTPKRKFDQTRPGLNRPLSTAERADEPRRTIELVPKRHCSPTEPIATPRSLEQHQDQENCSMISNSPLAERSTFLASFPSEQANPQFAILESQYEELQAEVLALRKESVQSKETIRTLEREHKEWEAVLAKTNGVDDEIKKELKISKKRVADLKAQRQNYSFLEPFFTLDTGKLAALDFPRLQKMQASIRSQLLGIFTVDGFQHLEHYSQLVDTSTESSDLYSLIRGLGLPYQYPGPNKASNSVPVIHLVQSLTAVSLRDWIFNDELTCTAIMGTPLVDAYRYHLSTICEADVLRGLDFAAHRWLFDQDIFKDVLLPKKASGFAERLLVALQPLIQNEYKETLEDTLRPTLQAIFHAGLEIKTSVMVSKDMYQCIWPTPEASFDPSTMETERDKFNPDTPDSNTNGMKVRHVLVPGLCFYEHDRHLVDYFGFKRENDACTGKPCVLYKAVVLV